MHYIKSHIRITNGIFFKDGKKIASYCDKPEGFAQVVRAFYKERNLSYPAFYKMDNLSKLGFCAAELLLENISWQESMKENELGIILANHSSCLDTDEAYFATICDEKAYFPSPAVFVYTLPNIVIGEICIRHKIKGENMFFIQPEFDPEFMVSYIDNILDSCVLKGCIGGWVEFYKDNYDAFLYFASRQNTEGDYPEHNLENIKKLYTTHGAIN